MRYLAPILMFLQSIFRISFLFFLFPFLKCKISVHCFDGATAQREQQQQPYNRGSVDARARTFVYVKLELVRCVCVCFFFVFLVPDLMAIISIPIEVNGASERTSGEKKHPETTLKEVKICVLYSFVLRKASR